MTSSERQDLICAVLDGVASTPQRQKFDDLLARDLEFAAEFRHQRQAAEGFAALAEIEPPREFGHDLMAKLAGRTSHSGFSHQLSGRSAVSGAWTSSLPGRVGALQGLFKERFMSEQGKGLFSGTRGRVLIGGGVAAVAVVVVANLVQFPGDGKGTDGSIAPADRYRSSQVPTANVQAGGQAAPAGNATADNAAQNAAAQSAERSANMAADKSANMAADKAANMAADKSANMAADKAANMAADKAANMAADKAANLAADKAANKAADKSANMAADKAANLAADKAANKAADKAANRTSN